MNRVLVVAAHPDDELLGSGATLVKHLRSGDEVHALVMSEGASSRYDDGMASELARAAEASAKVLGLTSLSMRRLPDQRLDTTPLLEVTQTVEELVRELRPTTVYTHWPHDVNADHGVVARAAWTACRPYSAPFVHRIAAFETPSSSEWAWPLTETAFSPQLYVDVSETLERKLEALGCYGSELRDYPHPRSEQALRERAAYWGSHVGVPFAEPFVLLRDLA